MTERFDFRFEDIACIVAGRETLATGEVGIEFDTYDLDHAPEGLMRVMLVDVETGDARLVLLNHTAILYHDLVGRCEPATVEACRARLLEDA